MDQPKPLAPSAADDDWLSVLRAATTARVGQGRAGGSSTTAELLRFQADHAAARDAVTAALDVPALRREIDALRLESLEVDSAAGTLSEFLQRPDWGRRLSPSSRDGLSEEASARGACDVALIVSAGLSPLAIERHAVAVLAELSLRLHDRGLTLSPVVVVRFGRVALQDEIGELLGATAAVTLLGERPGLGTPDSLGAYLVHTPRHGNTDANRNCVSNIHANGLTAADAAATLDRLLGESLRLGYSGVELKDAPDALPG